MLDKELFQRDPRDYALQLVSDGLQSADHLLLCALKYMSHDDVRDMLDCNELSPRFDEDDEEDEDNDEEDADDSEDADEEEEEFELTSEPEVRDAFWDEHPEFADERDSQKSQNDYRADIRMAFVDLLDSAHRSRRISDELAADVTL